MTDATKRLLVGRALRSDRLGETLLPKKLALPLFASDAMSSVAYATQEVVLIIALAGTAYLYLTWWAALAVVIVMVTVISAYRFNVQAYPSGGGDYEIVNTNLGRRFGMVVAAALMVDYVLTVAVSTSAGVDNLASTGLFDWMSRHHVATALIIVTLMVVANLRGIRESGQVFAVFTYGFMVGILGMIAFGVFRVATGDQIVASSAQYDVQPAVENLGTIGLLLLVARAFASGCTALTGVEAISNGVPAFQEPKPRNAATTLGILGVFAVTMFVGVTYLAVQADVHYVEDVGNLIGYSGDSQPTVIAQIAEAVFGGQNFAFYYVQLVTALILVLAANTAFNGFPVLASVLAQDRLMPRQMHTRGDRLVFSNGIALLAAFAGLLIWAFDAEVSALIQLYIVGVFTSFTLSQIGMVIHWNRLLAADPPADARASMLRRRALAAFTTVVTGVVLAVILITKFVHGAWITVVAMGVLWLMMRAISEHYERVADELVVDEDERITLPSRVHAVVLVSKIHKPTMRALAYARASRPTTLEALTVDVDAADTRALQDEWDRRGIPVPLRVLHSPFREITRPVINEVRRVRRRSPRDLVVVYVPQYVVGHWWEQLLHNQSALRLKTRLLFTPGVLVVSVPWQLASSESAVDAEPEDSGVEAPESPASR